MTIYIELVIVQNFLVNFFLLFLCVKILRLNFSKLRLVLASLFGVLFSFAFVLISLPLMPQIALKILSGLFCVLVLFKKAKCSQVFKCFSLFCALTFCFGGTVYACLNAFNLNAANSNSFNFIISCSFILLVPFVYCSLKFARRLNAHKKVSSLCYDAKIKFGSSIVTTRGFYDSGNRLKDKTTGKPINIISLSLASRLCGESCLSEIVCEIGETKNSFYFKDNVKNSIQNGRFVEFSTVGDRRKKMFVFEVSEIELKINGKFSVIKNALCGVMLKNFKDVLSYEMLLNSETI